MLKRVYNNSQSFKYYYPSCSITISSYSSTSQAQLCSSVLPGPTEPCYNLSTSHLSTLQERITEAHYNVRGRKQTQLDVCNVPPILQTSNLPYKCEYEEIQDRLEVSFDSSKQESFLQLVCIYILSLSLFALAHNTFLLTMFLIFLLLPFGLFL